MPGTKQATVMQVDEVTGLVGPIPTKNVRGVESLLLNHKSLTTKLRPGNDLSLFIHRVLISCHVHHDRGFNFPFFLIYP